MFLQMNFLTDCDPTGGFPYEVCYECLIREIMFIVRDARIILESRNQLASIVFLWFLVKPISSIFITGQLAMVRKCDIFGLPSVASNFFTLRVAGMSKIMLSLCSYSLCETNRDKKVLESASDKIYAPNNLHNSEWLVHRLGLTHLRHSHYCCSGSLLG